MSETMTSLRAERARHWEQRGDYRDGYRRVCSLCSVQRSEPYYNERRSWREPEEWPCATSVALDTALSSLTEELDQAYSEGYVDADNGKDPRPALAEPGGAA